VTPARRRWCFAGMGTATLLVTGCAQFGGGAAAPESLPKLPTLSLDADDRFSSAAGAPQPTAADLRWWWRFDDAALASWVERALDDNPGIAIADAQVAQARALLQSARARRGMQLGAQADAALRLQRGAGQRRRQPGAAFTLDYDADLWGGLRQAEASAAAGLLRSQDLAQAARLATAALAARAYLEWRVALSDARLLADVSGLRRDVLRVVTIRVDAGLAPVLDRDRAAAELAATEAEQAAAAVRARQALGALQVLAGERPRPPPLDEPTVPDTAGAAGRNDIAALQGVQPVARPLDLLRQRPDLRAAEQALVGAAADVGVARAALLPRLRLPGSLVFGAVTGGGVLELATATLAAALDVTLFDGGAGRADVDVARARARAAAQVYRQTLLQALQQVESALVAQQGAAMRVAARERASAAADAAQAQAQALYRAGLVGSLELIDAQRTALANRRALLQARADASAATVLAFEAMGLIDAP
jgi:multidrug efflux system outer membrane protein